MCNTTRKVRTAIVGEALPKVEALPSLPMNISVLVAKIKKRFSIAKTHEAHIINFQQAITPG